MRPLNNALMLMRRWRRLSAAERRFCAHVWLLLSACEACLPRMRTETLLARDVHVAGAARLTTARAVSLIEAVAAVHPARPRCLARAIVGSWALRASGIQTEVVVGCARTAPFEAHAWLRQDGHPLIGGATAGRYDELHAFRSDRGAV